MSNMIVWKIAGPTIALGGVLLGVGIFAAWNIHHQQKMSSDWVAKEVHSLLAVEELNLAMREIRYQLNLFLRTEDLGHLQKVNLIHTNTDKLLIQAKSLSTTIEEQDLLKLAELGYHNFFSQYSQFTKDNNNLQVETESEIDGTLAQLNPSQKKYLEQLDLTLTERVLEPLNRCIAENQTVVDRTDEASRMTSRHIIIGLLLMGLCGGMAGVLMGLAVARAVGRSIVQLNVSVQTVAGRLSDIRGPVSFTHYGELDGIEANLKSLERDIEEIVETFQQHESALLRSEQLARVGQMAAGLAHELRNPLMPMKMLVQAALQKGSEGKLSSHSLQVLNEEIIRLEKTIQSFLDFARPNAPNKAPLNMCVFLKDSAEFVRARMEELDIEMEVSLPSQDIVANVDKNQMKQLFLNLSNNALDAMPNGGRFHIQLSRLLGGNQFPSNDLSNRSFTVPLPLTAQERQESWIELQFQDTGAGIESTILDQLFEPFITTKETGTGLGLSTCKQIATAHRGYLLAENSPGGGAHFRLLLPMNG